MNPQSSSNIKENLLKAGKSTTRNTNCWQNKFQTHSQNSTFFPVRHSFPRTFLYSSPLPRWQSVPPSINQSKPTISLYINEYLSHSHLFTINLKTPLLSLSYFIFPITFSLLGFRSPLIFRRKK